MLAERCLELLNLDEGPKLLLDIGSGSGLSGEVIQAAGHGFLGLDISPDMLDVARQRDPKSEHILSDVG